jgi:8-oxo-dGTP pyrophosphatase MutT (NUDIX family)
MSSVTRYVAGFLFDPKGELVLLIEKKRPEWMAGKWNGVGGRIGAGETPLQAMARKGEEETGLSPETPSPLVSNLPVLIALALDRSGIRKPVYLQDDSPPQES